MEKFQKSKRPKPKPLCSSPSVPSVSCTLSLCCLPQAVDSERFLCVCVCFLITICIFIFIWTTLISFLFWSFSSLGQLCFSCSFTVSGFTPVHPLLLPQFGRWDGRGQPPNHPPPPICPIFVVPGGENLTMGSPGVFWQNKTPSSATVLCRSWLISETASSPLPGFHPRVDA